MDIPNKVDQEFQRFLCVLHTPASFHEFSEYIGGIPNRSKDIHVLFSRPPTGTGEGARVRRVVPQSTNIVQRRAIPILWFPFDGVCPCSNTGEVTRGSHDL